MITLVIARTDEALDWLHGLPAHCEVKVCNAGPGLRSADLLPGTEILGVRADAGCAGSHIEYLQQLQHRLATAEQHHLDPNGWTVFTPGDGLAHAPALMELLAQPQNWGDVQALGLRATTRAPARDDRREWVGGQPVRVERFCLHTLAPVGHIDREAELLADQYRHRHALPAGHNLLAHFLDLAGRHDLATSATLADLGLCAAGGVFAVRNDRLLALLQDANGTLDRLELLLRSDLTHRLMLERCWLHLFGLPFVAFDPLPRPAPVQAPASPALARVVASIDALLARSTIPALLHRPEPSGDAPRRGAPTRRMSNAGPGLRLSAIAALDLPSHGDAAAAPAWIPELDRIGQIGARLREHALS
jgi:hypothetical protein